jgi:hypothetical protein
MKVEDLDIYVNIHGMLGLPVTDEQFEFLSWMDECVQSGPFKFAIIPEKGDIIDLRHMLTSQKELFDEYDEDSEEYKNLEEYWKEKEKWEKCCYCLFFNYLTVHSRVIYDSYIILHLGHTKAQEDYIIHKSQEADK